MGNNFCIANTELKTGRQLNIHPPGQINIEFFNTFVSVMNDSMGFAQVVSDPLKIALKPFEAKSPHGKKDKGNKNNLEKILHRHIVKGTIANREQLISFIEENVGEVTRAGSDYISVVFPGTQRPKRLRGPLFMQGSDYTQIVHDHYASKVPKYLTPDQVLLQQEKLTAHIQARSQFN